MNFFWTESGSEASAAVSIPTLYSPECIYGYQNLSPEEIFFSYIPKIDQGEIYCITNIRNKKRYIGKTKSMKKINGQYHRKGTADRVLKHFQLAFKENNDCPRFYEAIRAEGTTDCFVWEILETCPLIQINQKEKYYIKLYKSRWQKYGYNLAKGGVPKKYQKRKKKWG